MELHPEQRAILNIFVGPGGTETGFKEANWQSTDGIELDEHACATIRTNHPYMKIHQGDVRDLLARKLSRRYYPAHCYTWPCDNYTNIAAIHDAQTGDDLYLQALRFQSLLWPECILIENVLGMREKFPVVMELWRSLPHYYCTEFTVKGHDFTLMRKSRVFLLLHRQPFRFSTIEEMLPLIQGFPAILMKPGRTLADYLQHPDEMDARCREEIQILPYMETRLAGGYQRPPTIYHWSQTTPINLPVNMRRDRSNNWVVDPITGKERPFTHVEIANLHGFPPGSHFCGGKNARYMQVVDSVMPPVAYLFGLLLNQYFEAIEELMPQPKALGHRMVQGFTTPHILLPAEPITTQDWSQQSLFA